MTIRFRPIATAPKDALILLREPHPSGKGWHVQIGRWIELPHENQYYKSWNDDPTIRKRAAAVLIANAKAAGGNWIGVYPAIYHAGTGEAFWCAKTVLMKPTQWAPVPDSDLDKKRRLRKHGKAA